MINQRTEFRDKMTEPVRKIIEENPGISFNEIVKKVDWRSKLTIEVTDKEFRNGLRQNHIWYLKHTGQIEVRRNRYYAGKRKEEPLGN